MENGFNISNNNNTTKICDISNKRIHVNKYEIIDENKQNDHLINKKDYSSINISNNNCLEDMIEIKKIPFKYKNFNTINNSTINMDKENKCNINHKFDGNLLCPNTENEFIKKISVNELQIHCVEKISYTSNASNEKTINCKKCKLSEILHKQNIVNIKENFNKVFSENKKEINSINQQLQIYKNKEIILNSEIKSTNNEIFNLKLSLEEYKEKLNDKLEEFNVCKLNSEKYLRTVVQIVSLIKEESEKNNLLKSEVKNIDDVFNLFFEISIEISKEMTNKNCIDDKKSNNSTDILSKDYLLKLEKIYNREKSKASIDKITGSDDKTKNIIEYEIFDEKVTLLNKSREEIKKIFYDLCNKIFNINDNLISRIYDLINKI